MEYGYALHASSGSPTVPGIMALTWIKGRDEAQRDRVLTHSGRIVADFLEEPGFIAFVTGFAGERGFTVTAWQDEASLYRALDQHHARAKQGSAPRSLARRLEAAPHQPALAPLPDLRPAERRYGRPPDLRQPRERAADAA